MIFIILPSRLPGKGIALFPGPFMSCLTLKSPRTAGSHLIPEGSGCELELILDGVRLDVDTGGNLDDHPVKDTIST